MIYSDLEANAPKLNYAPGLLEVIESKIFICTIPPKVITFGTSSNVFSNLNFKDDPFDENPHPYPSATMKV